MLLLTSVGNDGSVVQSQVPTLATHRRESGYVGRKHESTPWFGHGIEGPKPVMTTWSLHPKDGVNYPKGSLS